MSKTKFLQTNVGKTLKAGLYVGASAIIGYLISATAGDAELFGPLTALINLLLVFVKQTFFATGTKNIGEN
ncbi:hypothetical protein KRR55_06000 [Paeniglutamicibacter sp. ABSL32-1]|uniref:hypothetical protein n=1 Tax=Paeniglutamicibacter quisquiliarum TaxID=2849498 RepID=UPI001C2D5B99|nr:hypothetical protein [Paeniglutamicibacter quisquiliarum]MBV1778664.1 hypothetical protein [Paeniglutamicibacter quisquiliarum]